MRLRSRPGNVPIGGISRQLFRVLPVSDREHRKGGGMKFPPFECKGCRVFTVPFTGWRIILHGKMPRLHLGVNGGGEVIIMY
jgi:hypothetical protein